MPLLLATLISPVTEVPYIVPKVPYTLLFKLEIVDKWGKLVSISVTALVNSSMSRTEHTIMPQRQWRKKTIQMF